MRTATKQEITKQQSPGPFKCVICGKPTQRLIDGEPACDYHANQVYEHQFEEYAKKHLS